MCEQEKFLELLPLVAILIAHNYGLAVSHTTYTLAPSQAQIPTEFGTDVVPLAKKISYEPRCEPRKCYYDGHCVDMKGTKWMTVFFSLWMAACFSFVDNCVFFLCE